MSNAATLPEAQAADVHKHGLCTGELLRPVSVFLRRVVMETLLVQTNALLGGQEKTDYQGNVLHTQGYLLYSTTV